MYLAAPIISHIFFFQDVVPYLIEGDDQSLIDHVERWEHGKRYRVFTEEGKREGFFFLERQPADTTVDTRIVWREDTANRGGRERVPKIIPLLPCASEACVGFIVVGRHLSWVNDQVIVGVPSSVVLPARRLASHLLIVHVPKEGPHPDAMLCSTVRVKSMFSFGFESCWPVPSRRVINAKTWHML